MSEFLGKRTYRRNRQEESDSSHLQRAKSTDQIYNTNTGNNQIQGYNPSNFNQGFARSLAPSAPYQPQAPQVYQSYNPGYSPGYSLTPYHAPGQQGHNYKTQLYPAPPPPSTFPPSQLQSNSYSPYQSGYSSHSQVPVAGYPSSPGYLRSPHTAGVHPSSVNLHLPLPSGQFSTPNSAPLSAVASGFTSGRASGKGSVSRGEYVRADRGLSNLGGFYPQNMANHRELTGYRPEMARGGRESGSRTPKSVFSDDDDAKSVRSERSYCPSLVLSEYQGFEMGASGTGFAGRERERLEEELAGVPMHLIRHGQEFEEFPQEDESPPEITEAELARRERVALIKEKLENKETVIIKSMLIENEVAAVPNQTESTSTIVDELVIREQSTTAHTSADQPKKLSDLKPIFNFDQTDLKNIPSLLKKSYHWDLRRVRNFLRNPEDPSAGVPKDFDPKTSKSRSSIKSHSKKKKSGAKNDQAEPELTLSEKYIQDTVEYTARRYISIVNGLSIYQDRDGERRQRFKEGAVNSGDRNVNQTGSSSKPSFRAVAKLINTLLRQLVLKDGDFLQLHNFHKSSLKLNHSSSFSFFDIVMVKTLILEYYEFLQFKQKLIGILSKRMRDSVVDYVRDWNSLRASIPGIMTDMMQKHGYATGKVIYEIQSLPIINQGINRILQQCRSRIGVNVPSKAPNRTEAELEAIAETRLEKDAEIPPGEKMPNLKEILDQIRESFLPLHHQSYQESSSKKQPSAFDSASNNNASFILPIATKSASNARPSSSTARSGAPDSFGRTGPTVSSSRVAGGNSNPAFAKPLSASLRDQLDILLLLSQDLALSRSLVSSLASSVSVKTNPTVSGNTRLNIYHQLYPAKKIHVRGKDIKSDLFLKVLEAESKGYVQMGLGFQGSKRVLEELAIVPAVKELLAKYLLQSEYAWMEKQRPEGFDLNWVLDAYAETHAGYLHEGCLRKMEEQAYGVVAYSYVVSVYEEVAVPHLGYFLQGRQSIKNNSNSGILRMYQPMTELSPNLVYALYLTKTLRVDVFRGSSLVYSQVILKESQLHPNLVNMLISALPELIVIHVNNPAARDLVNTVTELVKDFCEITAVEKSAQPKIIPVNCRQNERQANLAVRSEKQTEDAVQTSEYTLSKTIFKMSQPNDSGLIEQQSSSVQGAQLDSEIAKNSDEEKLDIGLTLNLMNTEFATFPLIRLVKERFQIPQNETFVPITKSPYRKYFSSLNPNILLVGFDMAVLQFFTTIGVHFKDFIRFPEVFGYFLGFKLADLQDVTKWMKETDEAAEINQSAANKTSKLFSTNELDGSHGRVPTLAEMQASFSINEPLGIPSQIIATNSDFDIHSKPRAPETPSTDVTGATSQKDTPSKLDAMETRSVRSGYSGRSKSTHKSRRGYIAAQIPEARLQKLLSQPAGSLAVVKPLGARLSSLKASHLLHYTLVANPLNSKLNLCPEMQILPVGLKSKLSSVYSIISECRCDSWEGINKLHTDLGRIIENIEESLILAGQSEVIRKLLGLRNIEVKIEERKVHASGDAEYRTAGHIPDNLSAQGSYTKEPNMPFYSRVGSAMGSAAGSYFNTSVIQSPNRSGATTPGRVQDKFRDGIIRGSPYLFYSKPNSSGARTPLRSESPNRPVRAPISDKFTSRSGSDRDDRSSCEDVDSVMGMPTGGGFYTRPIPIFYNSTSKQVASFNRIKQELSWILTYVDVLINPVVIQGAFWEQRLKSARHRFEETYFTQLELIRRDRVMPVKVASFDEQNIYVTILGIVPGLINLSATPNPYSILSRLKVGENIPARVVKISPKRGVVLLSIKEEDFSDLTQYLRSNKVLEEYGLKLGQSFTLHYLDLKNLDHHKIAAKSGQDKKKGNWREQHSSCRDFHRWSAAETERKFREISRLVVAYTPHEESERHLQLTFRVLKERIRRTVVKVHAEAEGTVRYEVGRGTFFQTLDEVTFKYVKPIVNMVQLLLTDHKGRKRWFEPAEREGVILELTAQAASPVGREIPYRVTLTECNRFGAIYYSKNGQVQMEVFRIVPGLYLFHKKQFTNLDHLAAYIRNNNANYVLEKSVLGSPRLSPVGSPSRANVEDM